MVRALLRLAAVLAALHPAMSDAQQRWLTIPATPTLPEPASAGHVDTKDARVWFATFGDRSKPAVLLLHGGGGSSDYWGHLVRDLARDYHVIVTDSRGQGRSATTSPVITYEEMAQDAVAVLDRIGVSQTAIVGWSDGANTGLILALRNPVRISALVAFAGNSTPAGYQPNTNPSTMQAYAARTRAEYQKLSPQPERYASTLSALSTMWKTQPTLTAKDLAAIKTRTAILHAEHDEVIRLSHSREIAGAIPNGTFVLLNGVSHFAVLQDPDGFSAAVRTFLRAR